MLLRYSALADASVYRQAAYAYIVDRYDFIIESTPSVLALFHDLWQTITITRSLARLN